MSTTFNFDGDNKNKGDKRSSETEDTHPLFTEDQIPHIRSNVLRGLCLFCENKAFRIEHKRNDPLVIGRSFTCESKECVKKWDELSSNQLRTLISWRALLG